MREGKGFVQMFQCKYINEKNTKIKTIIYIKIYEVLERFNKSYLDI